MFSESSPTPDCSLKEKEKRVLSVPSPVSRPGPAVSQPCHVAGSLSLLASLPQSPWTVQGEKTQPREWGAGGEAEGAPGRCILVLERALPEAGFQGGIH